MKRFPSLIVPAALAALLASPAGANDRYAEPPPLVVSPDLSAPWVLQLRRAPVAVETRTIRRGSTRLSVRVAPDPVVRQRRESTRTARPVERQPDVVRTSATAAASARDTVQLDPKFLPQVVDYDGPQKPGTIVVDTANKFLYLIESGGKARRYGVGVGKEGFLWRGTEKITAKREWPDWRPPAEMIAREKKKGRTLPTVMAGGPANPLGARALYLGDTLYRIHGTNAPWTIGHNVSSGCIRMRNEDVIDLYERVKTGATVQVI